MQIKKKKKKNVSLIIKHSMLGVSELSFSKKGIRVHRVNVSSPVPTKLERQGQFFFFLNRTTSSKQINTDVASSRYQTVKKKHQSHFLSKSLPLSVKGRACTDGF